MHTLEMHLIIMSMHAHVRNAFNNNEHACTNVRNAFNKNEHACTHVRNAFNNEHACSLCADIS